MEVKEKDNKTSSVLFKLFYIVLILGILLGFHSYLTDRYTVYLVSEEMILNEGDIGQIELLPKNMDLYNLNNYRFKSNDKDTVYVDNSGLVQGIKEGNAKVKIRYKLGFLSQKINIKVEKVNIDNIILDSNIEIEKNSTKRIKPLINNDEKINATLNYSTDDDSVLKVDSLGNVTGLKAGTAKLIAESSNGIKAESTITVKESDSKIEEIKFADSKIVLDVDESKDTVLDIYPSNASTESIVYKSSDIDVINVDYKGTVTAKKEGYAVISATTESGLVANTAVICGNETIFDEETVVVSENNMIMYVGEEREVIYQLLPPSKDKNNKYLVSSDSEIVSVKTGKLVAKKVGETTVSINTDNEDLAATINVKVKAIKTEVDSIKINNENNISLYVNDDIRLSATITPEDASNKKIKWTSSNEKVAKVTSTGIVIGLKRGSARITAESSGGQTDSINVVVRNEDNNLLNDLAGAISGAINTDNDVKLTEFDISSDNCTLENNDEFDAYVINMTMDSTCKINTSFKEEISNKNIVYNVEQEKFGTFVEVTDGVIKATRLGQNRVEVIPEANKELKKTIFVNVYDPNLKNVVINEPSIINIKKKSTYQIKATFEPSNYSNKKILYTTLDKNSSIIEGFSAGNFNINETGTTTIYAYPMANPKLGKVITFEVGYGFINNCASTPAKESKDFKSQVTNKTRKVTTHICLDDLQPMFQGFAISDKYVYGSSPVHAWCTPETKDDKNQTIPAQAINAFGTAGNCVAVNNKNYKDNKDARVTARYVGSTSILKYDRKTGQLVSRKTLDLAGHGQAFDVTKDDKIYANYFANTDLVLNGRIGGGYTGVGLINGITNEIDKAFIHPDVAIKVANNGTLEQFFAKKEFEESATPSEFNTKVLKLSTANPLLTPQFAIDESKGRIALMRYQKTSAGNRTIYTYKLDKFLEAQNSGTSTIYEYRRYIGKVCGLASAPIDCGNQGMEVSGKYIYTVQDYIYNNVKYANISIIDFDSCPKEDTKTKKCTKVENFFLNKSKYVDSSIKDTLIDIEIEGISVYNGRIYISLFDKYKNTNNYKTKVVLVYGL